MTVEKDFKPIKSNGVYYIQYKGYSSYLKEWKTHLFKDVLGNLLYFTTEKDALDWIEARKSIINN